VKTISSLIPLVWPQGVEKLDDPGTAVSTLILVTVFRAFDDA